MSLRRYLTSLRDMRAQRGEPVTLTAPGALSLSYTHEESAKLQREVRNVDREDASSPILAGEE